MKIINTLKRKLTESEKIFLETLEIIVQRDLKKDVFSIKINPVKNNESVLYGFSIALEIKKDKK